MVEGTARNGASATASSRRLAVHVLGLGREILRSALLYSVYAVLSANAQVSGFSGFTRLNACILECQVSRTDTIL